MPRPDDDGAEIVLAPGVLVAKSALSFSFIRGRGPGGQSVNKVATCAQLQVPLPAIQGLSEAARNRVRTLAGQRRTEADVLLFESHTHRSQLDNRAACVARLRDLIKRAVPEPKRRRKTKPSRGAVERRLRDKREHKQRKARRRPPERD